MSGSNSKLFQNGAGILKKDACVVLVKTEWNAAVVDELEKGCVEELVGLLELDAWRLCDLAGRPGGQGDLPGQAAPAEDVLDLVLTAPPWGYGRPGRHYGRGQGPQEG